MTRSGRCNVKRRANGEGTIKQRKDGRWEAQVALTDGSRKSLYAKTQRELVEKRDSLMTARRRGLPVVNERQTVQAFLASWLESVKPPAGRIRPKTWTRYEQLVRVHVIPTIGHIAIARLQPQHMQAMYASRLAAGAAPRSVRHVHALLHRALGQAMRWGIIPRNVIELIDPPRAPRHDMVTLNEAQVRALLETSAGDRDEALYAVAVTTGMRQGELLGLR
jgi:integrase